MRDQRRHPFRDSIQDREAAQHFERTAQTASPTYRLAFNDPDFLLKEELRPVRLQLELLKPELVMNEAGVKSTIVLFGGARIPEPAKAGATPASLAALSPYYDEARKFARLMTEHSVRNGGLENVIVTGGGPGVMEAGNRGAAEAGGKSIGLNIVLPHEQAPNPYVTPELSFQFHYFALRKMHFLLRARALAVFPGGFGTFDEMFELLTLIQTGKMKPIPILLFGKDFWNRVVDFEALADEGVIAPSDLNLLTWVETAEDAWAAVQRFYQDSAAPTC